MEKHKRLLEKLHKLERTMDHVKRARREVEAPKIEAFYAARREEDKVFFRGGPAQVPRGAPRRVGARPDGEGAAGRAGGEGSGGAGAAPRGGAARAEEGLRAAA